MNKRFSILVIPALTLFLSPPDVFSQDKNIGADENLYQRASFASLDKMAKSWGDVDVCDPDREVRTDYKKIIMEKNSTITDKLNSQLGEYHVKYLDE